MAIICLTLPRLCKNIIFDMRRILIFVTLILVSAALFPATAQKTQRDSDTALTEEKHDTITESIITALADKRMNSTQTGLKRINSKDLNSGFALFSTPDVIYLFSFIDMEDEQNTEISPERARRFTAWSASIIPWMF